MRKLAFQAALHLSARMLSVLLSFALFVWVGKILSPLDALQAFQFLFVLGFAVAASRACIHLSARVDGMASAKIRLRSLHVGFTLQMWLLFPLGAFVFLSTWLNSYNFILSLLALLIFLPAAFDADAVRSVFRRPSLFALAFFMGSGLAIAALALVLPLTLNGVMIAFLIQWLPVCILNLFVLSKHSQLLTIRPARVSDLAKVLLAASFDGIILNAPFFGLVVLQTQVALDSSLIIRIFVAALPLFPLLMHWSNSSDFPLLCKRAGLSTRFGFSMSVVVSGLFFGLGFAMFYHQINESKLSFLTILSFTILLSTFSMYFSQARFSKVFLESSTTTLLLLGTISAYLVILRVLGPDMTILQLTTLQGGTFLLASFLMVHNEKFSLPIVNKLSS